MGETGKDTGDDGTVWEVCVENTGHWTRALEKRRLALQVALKLGREDLIGWERASQWEEQLMRRVKTQRRLIWRDRSVLGIANLYRLGCEGLAKGVRPCKGV